ncbi:MAG TPA: Rid family hydrolase [Sphingomicrobium sp.]|nr:Rid family hydrolase [Sphingomicrobium sp.]
MARTAALAACLLAPAAAEAGSRQEATVLLSEDPAERKFQEEWGYADAIVAGDTIYLSGVVAGSRPGEADLKPAFQRAFEKIGGVLKRAGASWDDVVDITSFHTASRPRWPRSSRSRNSICAIRRRPGRRSASPA